MGRYGRFLCHVRRPGAPRVPQKGQSRRSIIQPRRCRVNRPGPVPSGKTGRVPMPSSQAKHRRKPFYRGYLRHLRMAQPPATTLLVRNNTIRRSLGGRYCSRVAAGQGRSGGGFESQRRRTRVYPLAPSRQRTVHRVGLLPGAEASAADDPRDQRLETGTMIPAPLTGRLGF